MNGPCAQPNRCVPHRRPLAGHLARPCTRHPIHRVWQGRRWQKQRHCRGRHRPRLRCARRLALARIAPKCYSHIREVSLTTAHRPHRLRPCRPRPSPGSVLVHGKARRWHADPAEQYPPRRGHARMRASLYARLGWKRGWCRSTFCYPVSVVPRPAHTG